MKGMNPRQMSSFTNNKAVIELMNKLQPATPGMGSHLHRGGEEKGEKRSLIGINVVNYQTSPSVFVEENLTPSQVKELYHEAIMKRQNYKFSGNGQKIFGNPDKDGLCIVRTIQIVRQGSYVGRDGKTVVKTYPWTVKIQNGKGRKESTAIGGTSCAEGSFRVEKEAAINLSDGDFFALLEKAYTYITAWERYYTDYFIKMNEKKIKEYEEAYRNRENPVSSDPPYFN